MLLFYPCLPIRIQVPKSEGYYYTPLYFQGAYLLNKCSISICRMSEWNEAKTLQHVASK